MDKDIEDFIRAITPEGGRAYDLTDLKVEELEERNILGDHIIPDGTEPAPNYIGLEDKII